MRTASILSLATTAVLLAPSVAGAQEEVNFFDEFQGSSLNPVFRVLNPDRRRMALTQGEFLLIVIDETGKNVIEYSGELPEDYSVTVRVDEPPRYAKQAFEIFVGPLESSVRAGAYLNVDCSNCPLRGPYFFSTKYLDGEQAPSVQYEDTALRGEPFYLRLDKRGVEFEGFLSSDGVKWTSLGRQVLIDPTAKVHFHAHAWEDAPETPVKIDSFEITEILN
jgi:hypothetical protein